MKIGRVYKIISIEGNEVYVGSTFKDIHDRFNNHRNSYKPWKEGKKGKCYVFELFDKYGIDSCEIILIKEYEVVDKSHLEVYESLWIKKLKSINRNTPFGEQNIKWLRKGYYKEHYKANIDAMKEYSKEYNEKNKDKMKEYSKEYYERNKAEMKAYHKEYYNKNKAEMKEYYKERYNENKDKTKEYYEKNKDKTKEYYEKNKDKNKDKKKEYYKKNKDAIKQRNKEYRINKMKGENEE